MLDWKNLGFQYRPVKSHIRYTYENGRWDEGRLCSDHTVNLSIASTCLHYGQACFEGLKAFRSKSGDVNVFRPDENSARMNKTLSYILAPEIPQEMFLDAIKKVVNDNIDYVPPYGTGGSLYIRPFVIGSGDTIGIAPSTKYEFIVLVTPVGAYYKGDVKPVDALIMEDFDRAAPLGTGHIKVAGNYAGGLKPNKFAKEKGFPITLFLDSKTRQYIEEFGTSNFIGITADKKYVTPKSRSILASITNKSLMTLAQASGLPVEKRQIHVSELPDFVEVCACGTAVVVTPIANISYGENIYHYGDDCGPVIKDLYEQVTAIQYGETEDKYDWLYRI